MPPLLVLDDSRRAREAANARLAEDGIRQWGWIWRRAYLQCLACMVVGYAIYGYSWGLGGDSALLAAAAGFVMAYVLPFLRLIVFFVHHSDQF